MKIDRVFVLLLVVMLPMSGCLGSDGDGADSDTEAVLINLSGSIEHNYCNLGPGEGTQATTSNNESNNNNSNNGQNNGSSNGTAESNSTSNQTNNTASNQSDNCPVDDETITDYWSAISNMTTLQQNSGESIKIHEWASVFFGTTCVNGAIAGWQIFPDNGDTYNNAQSSSVDGLLPFPGQECVHTLHYMAFSNSTVYWSLTYEIIPVTSN